MGARKGGSRRGTRRTFRKSHRDRGKVSINKYFAQFAIGDQALLRAEPAVQDGLYHARYHSRPGVIVEKRGSCYGVKVKDGNKDKVLYVHPVHLRKL